MSLFYTVQWLPQKWGKCANPSWPRGSYPHWYDYLIIRLPANCSSLTICYAKLLSSTPASVQPSRAGCAEFLSRSAQLPSCGFLCCALSFLFLPTCCRTSACKMLQWRSSFPALLPFSRKQDEPGQTYRLQTSSVNQVPVSCGELQLEMQLGGPA